VKRAEGPCAQGASHYGFPLMSARLYVGNLSHESTAETLRAAFSEFGEVADVQVVVDRYSGRPRGFAFVTMTSPEHAAKATAKMNGAMLDGRPVRVSDADPRRASAAADAGVGRRR
jgi:RNA recognition motif-containing protein